MSNDTSKIIAEHNDRFRSKIGILPIEDNLIKGKYLITQGIDCLPMEEQISIINQVREFKDFNQNNDPYGEHDFGKFSDNLHDVMWKIDYYDTDYKFGSADPSDPAQTRRVLTVMLACEY